MALEIPFMRDPPPGEDRFAAGTTILSQRAIGAWTFAFGTIVYGLRVFSRLGLVKVPLRTDDCEFDSRGLLVYPRRLVTNILLRSGWWFLGV